jgi:hypothetical protein
MVGGVGGKERKERKKKEILFYVGPALVVHTCNPSIREAEAGELQV